MQDQRNPSLSRRWRDEDQCQAAQINRDAWQYWQQHTRRNAIAKARIALATALTLNTRREVPQRRDGDLAVRPIAEKRDHRALTMPGGGP